MAEPVRSYWTAEVQVPDGDGGWTTVGRYNQGGAAPAEAAWWAVHYSYPGSASDAASDSPYARVAAREAARRAVAAGRVLLTPQPYDADQTVHTVTVRDAYMDAVRRAAAATRDADAAYAEAYAAYRKARDERLYQRTLLEAAAAGARAAGADDTTIRRAKAGPRKPRTGKTSRPAATSKPGER